MSNRVSFEVPQEDRAIVAQFFAFLARADHEVTDDEKQALQDICQLWQLSESETQDVKVTLDHGADLLALVSRVTNPRTPYLLLQELILQAMLDASYSDVERTAIRQIADAFGISKERVLAIEQWVNDGVSWRLRAAELLHAETL